MWNMYKSALPHEDGSEGVTHKAIDVEVDTGVDSHEEVSDWRHGLHPVRKLAANAIYRLPQ